jgi:MFS family permease
MQGTGVSLRSGTVLQSDLRELLVSDILIQFPAAAYTFVILGDEPAAGAAIRLVVAVGMVTAMLCYIPVAHLADKHSQRPFVLATFMFFTLFPITLL